QRSGADRVGPCGLCPRGGAEPRRSPTAQRSGADRVGPCGLCPRGGAEPRRIEAAMTALRQTRAIARLDLAEVLRSRWMVVSMIAYAALAVVFVAVGQREAPLLGYTGSARVLFSLSHALVVLLPLFALTATAPAIGRARDDGSLELLFSQPLGRGAYLAAITAVRAIAILAPVAALYLGVSLW